MCRQGENYRSNIIDFVMNTAVILTKFLPRGRSFQLNIVRPIINYFRGRQICRQMSHVRILSQDAHSWIRHLLDLSSFEQKRTLVCVGGCVCVCVSTYRTIQLPKLSNFQRIVGSFVIISLSNKLSLLNNISSISTNPS